MPVRGSGVHSGAARGTLVRSPSAPSGLAPGFSRRGAAELFSELRVSDAAGSRAQQMPSVPSMPGVLLQSAASMPSMAMPAAGGAVCLVPPAPQAPHVSSMSYSGPCLTPCCDQASLL